MNLPSLGREISAGLVLGLSAVIYALSYGALLFSVPWASFVGIGITITLITAIFGALSSWKSPDRSFIGGPDSNTISVTASLLATSSIFGSTQTPELAVAVLVTTTLFSSIVFYALGRTGLSSAVRYIPFPVMAGFLAATGWLMCSGALNMISDTPLSQEGWARFVSNPLRPELIFGLLIALTLTYLAPRVSAALLIPAVMFAATAVAHTVLSTEWCGACDRSLWFFPRPPPTTWLPPWEMSWGMHSLSAIVQSLPAMLVISLVGTLTILLSVASLELSFQREFPLDQVLKTHSAAGLASAALGGFMPIISIGRTTLNRKAGGHGTSATVAAAMCLALLLGAGSLLTWIPKAALGGLVLFLGIGMLRQWLWDQRNRLTRIEFFQIVLIVILVAHYGFLVGFSSGVLIACIIFVINYSRIPLADLSTNLSEFCSSVSRTNEELKCLREHGSFSHVFRLSGYIFFGSATKIEGVFQCVTERSEAIVLDFSNVSGIDRSAIAIFQRLIRRHLSQGENSPRFHIVVERNQESVKGIFTDLPQRDRIDFHESVDHAVEQAEDELLVRYLAATYGNLHFLENDSDRTAFLKHCEKRFVSAGTVLSAEGEDSSEIFILEHGSLEVVRSTGRGSSLRLAKLRPGAMVGELAFYTGEVRTASIVAASDATVQVVRRSALDQLRLTHPLVAMRFDHSVIRKLSHSLVRANALITSLR